MQNHFVFFLFSQTYNSLFLTAALHNKKAACLGH